MTSLLEVAGLSCGFGGVRALADVSLGIEHGVAFAVIGPNGAGKSTLLNAVTGLLAPAAGRVLFGGADITGWATHRIVARGVGRTFQNGRLFGRLSALENVMVGGHAGLASGFGAALLGTPGFRREEAALAARSLALLDRLGMADIAGVPVGALPYGKRRQVELARALVSEPKLLLLDEPAAGLNSAEVEELIGFLAGLRAEGLTIVVIEHNMGLVMRLADRIAVLNFGRLIAEGRPSEIQRNEAVLEAYLGRGYGHAVL
jgi:ABC-type branched-subunit amino acid transport system ATPase component